MGIAKILRSFSKTDKRRFIELTDKARGGDPNKDPRFGPDMLNIKRFQHSRKLTLGETYALEKLHKRVSGFRNNRINSAVNNILGKK